MLHWTGTKVIGKQNGDGKYTSITLKQSFNLYGLFVDYATGSNTPRGNHGDLGRDVADTVGNALTRNISRRFVT